MAEAVATRSVVRIECLEVLGGDGDGGCGSGSCGGGCDGGGGGYISPDGR